MKKIFFTTLTLALLAVTSSCTHTRPLTEQYIKTEIEQHTVGSFSTIRTYSIFKEASLNSTGFCDLTGYKYGEIKKLIIGAEKYFFVQKNFKEDNTIKYKTDFIELTVEQCNDIISNYKIIYDKIKSESIKGSKEVTHDYTVNKDLFISYKKTSSTNPVLIDLWIKGTKYSYDSQLIIRSIKKFIEY